MEVRGRRRHFLARRKSWPFFKGPAWTNPYVCGLLRMIALNASGPGIETYMPEAKGYSWRCEVGGLGQGDEERKLEALSRYLSQARAFGGMGRVRAILKRCHRLLGGEPLWTCAPAERMDSDKRALK